MQHLKNFNWKKFLLQGVLPCLLAVAVGFISRYQLELSDGVTERCSPSLRSSTTTPATCTARR